MIPFESAFIVGALPSGLFAALYLQRHGVRVFVSEHRNSGDDQRFVSSVQLLEQAGIPYEFGGNTVGIMTGYDAVVVSPGVPLDAAILVAAGRLGKFVVGEMEIAAYADLAVLAVTGSNGKSTTTALLGEMVAQQYPDVVIGGNLGTPVSQLLVEHPAASLAVLEVSCFQLETIHTFHPRVAVFSNLVPNHLDRYGTMKRYFETKQRIFANMDEKDAVVLNWDDHTLRELGSALVPRAFYFGLEDGTYSGVSVNGGVILFHDGEHLVELFREEDVRIPGRHNIANAMSAALAAFVYGVAPEAIQAGIKRFNGLPHRLEYVGTVAGVACVNDSKATTPESVITASRAMSGPYVVILGGSSKGVSFDGMAEYLAGDTNLKSAIVMGTTGPAIAASLLQAGMTRIVHAESLEEGVSQGISLLKGGGTLLLSPACASFDMFRDFEERGDRFRAIVHSLGATIP
ncbi:MAG: UDP-N-acetylmuramoyl-L-alanine--D-glutamate ligase [Candidatus Cryosericum sp.]|nr:UDP-N-acetylmuramoyl-L-alanine--D-glutamate ligase [bacterium]